MRLAVAATVFVLVGYVLSWQLLWGGMAGSEAPFHLHLIDWVATTFPNLPWWYPWDGMGVSYREAYPLAAHWLAVLVSRLLGTAVEGGAQVVQFSMMPATALGLYAFFDWRLGRPLAGLAAGVLFLLSPIGWVEWTHFGLYASWVGMVFFMPSLIALDAFFFAWLRRDRGWRFRLSAASFVVLTTAMGLVSPHILAAPLIVLPAYALAIPRVAARRAWSWVLVATPAAVGGIVLLSAFWLGAELQYLAVVRSHWAGAGTSFDPGRLSAFDVAGILSLHALRDGNVSDLYSVSPAVLLPALLSIPLAWHEARARILLFLGVLGVVFMADRDLYRPFFLIPGFKEFGVVAHRPLQLLVAVAAPALAALGLFELPGLLAGLAARKYSWPPVMRSTLALALPVVLVLVLAADVFAFGARVDGGTQLAYGPSLPKAPDLGDLWQHHPSDACSPVVIGFAALCSDYNLVSTFSVQQLVGACRVGGRTRSDAPVCRGLGLDDPQHLAWNRDPSLISQTKTWCQGRSDPVCDAVYASLAAQLLDPGQWRAPEITCALDCPAKRQALAALAAAFPSPPARAELNSDIGPLDMAFHVLAGGGITHSYNDQVLPSRELSSWLEDSMLHTSGVTVKTQLAQALGIDAVVLSGAQAGQGADYESMGWTQVSREPLVYVNPQPSGLAAQWPGGTGVLVVGGTQDSVPALYNSVFEQATSGLMPFDSEWLVRGTSSYIDDYSDQQLERYPGLLLLGYRYHDQRAAWSLLDRYVRGGGRLFVETGWQYVDPDWNAGPAPSVLPVASLQWGSLDPAAPVLVQGADDPSFGRFVYQGGAWGASSAGSVRQGATELVRVGGRVVAARSNVGQGRVLWSGMNWIAHNSASGSADEAAFLAAQLAWVFAGDSQAGTQAPLTPSWTGDSQASIALQPSAGPSLVLFKESLFPGWSARLVTPTGSQPVDLAGSEMDFVLASLPAVPAGSSLVFTYGPTAVEQGSWGLSLVFLALLIAWVARPALFARGRHWTADRAASVARRLLGPFAERAGTWGDDP
ncbi:MAG TPA: hypothetical protein VNF91_00870 [Candidatus Acidoferrum sp.]|nr:hypothetical protein [Candidatus Acidoferrum sp.]